VKEPDAGGELKSEAGKKYLKSCGRGGQVWGEDRERLLRKPTREAIFKTLRISHTLKKKVVLRSNKYGQKLRVVNSGILGGGKAGQSRTQEPELTAGTKRETTLD